MSRKLPTAGSSIRWRKLLLKMTLPGVPDFYQGTELWDFNLVDPDNRRPVDFDDAAPHGLNNLLDRVRSGSGADGAAS